MIPDTHAHLDLIEDEPREVLASASRAGVSPVITIGITVESSARAVELAGSLEGVYAAVGIHPNDTAAVTRGDFERLESIAGSSDRVVAIGETGLDYYRDRSPADRQEFAFREHVRLARKLGHALVVHDREAHADVLEVLEEERAAEVPVVMHCFSGGTALLEKCVEMGFYISFAGPVTFKKSETAREAARRAPLDRLLAETDTPFLSPEPYRGKPNLPERVVHVARALADLRSIPIEQMGGILNENAARAFGIDTGGVAG